jgi:hypothetical protein
MCTHFVSLYSLLQAEYPWNLPPSETAPEKHTTHKEKKAESIRILQDLTLNRKSQMWNEETKEK